MMQYAKLKVLVVDDHMIIRSLVSQILQDIGLKKIDVSGDPLQAIQQVTIAQQVQDPYSIVFLDWTMPEKSGLDVLKHFRSQEIFANTAFIMLTAKKEERDVIQAIQSGATSYITKPIKPEQLKKHIDKTVEWLKKRNSNSV